MLLKLLLALWLTSGPSLGQTPARVKVALAPVTAAADSTSEQVTQVLLWDPVTVLKVEGEWARVLVSEQYRTDRGYPGWMRSSALQLKAAAMTGPRLATSFPVVVLRESPSTQAAPLLKVFMSTRLPVRAPKGQGAEQALRRDASGEAWYPVELPDGSSAWVRASQVQVEQEPGLSRGSELVDDALKLRSTPYLWGGMSQVGIDCSGLTFVAYRMAGVTLPRDADQQFQVGEAVTPEELQPGDLVFFGQPGEITHVGMYAGNGAMVHASSGAGVISSTLFEGWYQQYYRGARRILRESGGGTRVLTPADGGTP